jgi:hypothetical protein
MSASTATATAPTTAGPTAAKACFLCLERQISGKEGPCRNCDSQEDKNEKAVCIYCTDPTDGACCCQEAMDKYGKVQCELCEIYYNYALAGEGWSAPCDRCNEAYIADFKAALQVTTKK